MNQSGDCKCKHFIPRRGRYGGKLHRLETEMHEAGVHIVGVLESRIQGNIDGPSLRYRIIESSAPEQRIHQMTKSKS